MPILWEKLDGVILTWLVDWPVLLIVDTGRKDWVSTEERLVAVVVETKLWLDEFLLLLVNGKFSWSTVAAGEVESPVGLLSEIGPLVNVAELTGFDNEDDDVNEEDVDESKDEIAPVFLVWTCVVFITADTANLALAESNINLDVGCDENDWSNPELPADSKLLCFNNCSSWSRCILRSCSLCDWKLSMLNSSVGELRNDLSL